MIQISRKCKGSAAVVQRETSHCRWSIVDRKWSIQSAHL